MAEGNLDNQRLIKDTYIFNSRFFIKGSWKAIVLFTLLGLIFSIAYLLIAPSRYEAISQVRLALIQTNALTQPGGIPLEEVSSFIARMKFPTTYRQELINACGYKNRADIDYFISHDLQFIAPRGLNNILEIKVLGNSPDSAELCAQEVIKQAQSSQMEVLEPYLVAANEQLKTSNLRIDLAKKLVEKADKSGNGNMSAGYWVARDELSRSILEKDKATEQVNFMLSHNTKLISPIYVNTDPVSPKKILSILTGLFIGLFIGLAFSILRVIKFRDGLIEKS